jgi:predicted aspartyl protease
MGRGGAPRSYIALIDTGASTTTISPKVVAGIQPQDVGTATLSRVGVASLTVIKYKIRLKFEGHLIPGRWFDLEVIEAAPVTPGVDVLIGQDLLKELTLLSNGPLGKLILMY